MAKRPLNECTDCCATWYPRGSDLSARCPKCGSENVTHEGLVLMEVPATPVRVASAPIAASNPEQGGCRTCLAMLMAGLALIWCLPSSCWPGRGPREPAASFVEVTAPPKPTPATTTVAPAPDPFHHHLGEALLALTRRDHRAAHEHAGKALELRPGHEEATRVRDLAAKALLEQPAPR
jgi:hypothetical protein